MTTETRRFVYFGDSVTDTGTVRELTSELLIVPFPLESAGYTEAFSNGPLYSDRVPELVGIETVENFAVGGGGAVGERRLGDLVPVGEGNPLLRPDADLEVLSFDLNFPAQVDRFVDAETAEPFEGSTTASIFTGLIDLGELSEGGSAPSPFAAVGTLAAIVRSTLDGARRLVDEAGVEHLIFYTFPNTSFATFGRLAGPEAAELGDVLVDLHAVALLGGAEVFRARGVDVDVVRLDELTTDIAADPATFGFRTLDEPVLLGFGTNPTVEGTPPDIELGFPENPEVAGLSPDEIAFYDFIHPTTALHGVFAAFSAASLEKDEAFLSDRSNSFVGDNKADLVFARDGDDRVWLGGGDDDAFAGAGDDIVVGGDGNDLIAGGDGDDRVAGRAGNDVLAGNAGDDTLAGGADGDILIGGLGADHLLGRGGDDLFLYASPALRGGVTGAADRIVGGRGFDTLALAVADDERAEVEAELAAGGGIFLFEALNLEVSGVEDAFLVDDRSALAEVDVAPELEPLLEAADLWGLV